MSVLPRDGGRHSRWTYHIDGGRPFLYRAGTVVVVHLSACRVGLTIVAFPRTTGVARSARSSRQQHYCCRPPRVTLNRGLNVPKVNPPLLCLPTYLLCRRVIIQTPCTSISRVWFAATGGPLRKRMAYGDFGGVAGFRRTPRPIEGGRAPAT